MSLMRGTSSVVCGTEVRRFAFERAATLGARAGGGELVVRRRMEMPEDGRDIWDGIGSSESAVVGSVTQLVAGGDA